jgi:ribonuclease R
VSIHSLAEYDDFQHIETDYCLVGRRSGRRFGMGDKIRIKVISANLTKRQLDYEWVLTSALAEEHESEKKRSEGSEKKKGAGREKSTGKRRPRGEKKES